tara:strand:+ start:65678 stop:69622 length:3945 start_codon:yes stop_codon:yes gene_type:complete
MRRRLKKIADFCRWSLYLSIVLTAVFLLLCRFLITQLYFYQTQIESYLSDILLTSVTAEAARGVWDNIYPIIELEGLQLGDDIENPGLRAGFVRAVPDYLQSILLQTAIWEELSIQDLSLELNQMPDDSWVIAGFSKGVRGASKASARQLADMLFRSRSIDIQNLSIDYNFEDGRSFNLKFSELRANNEPSFHRISLEGQVDGDENGIEATLELSGVGFQFDQMQGQAYLVLAGADMSNLFATLFAGYIETRDNTPILVEGEIWFDISPGSEIEMTGQAVISDFHLVDDDAPLSLDSDLWGHRSTKGDWRFDLVDFGLIYGEQSMGLLQLSTRRDEAGVRFLTESIALEEIDQKIANLEIIPQSLKEAIKTLSPRGNLASASVLFSEDSQQNLRWLLEGNLDSVFVESYRGAPKIENLSGYFVMDSGSGELLIDSSDTSIHFNKLFQQEIFNQSLRGQVGWQIDSSAGELGVYSGPITSSDQNSQSVTQFHLSTALSSGDFPSNFTLITGVRDGNGLQWPQYLPTLGGETLIQWFENSNLEGALPEAGFIYRGTIGLGAENIKTVQLAGEAINAKLTFAPGWPEMTELNSKFWLSDRKFYSLTEQSRLGPVALTDTYTEVDYFAEAVVSARAMLNGDLNDLADLLRTTPIRSMTGESMDGLLFSGPAEIELNLQQPLKSDLATEEMLIRVKTSLSDNGLHLETLNIPIEGITGTLQYDQDGLRSDNLTAQLWGNRLQAVIKTDEVSVLSLNSDINISALTGWVNLPILESFEGVFSAQAEVSFASRLGAAPEFRLWSDTLGVASNLPVPLQKDLDQKWDLEISSRDSPADGPRLDLVWGEPLALSLNFDEQGKVYQSAFSIFSDLPEMQTGKLVGSASLDNFDYLDWQTVAITEEEIESALAPDISVLSQQTWFAGMDLGPMQSQFSYNDAIFNFDFTASFGEGNISFGETESDIPHHLSLDWIDIKAFTDISKANTPVAADTTSQNEEGALEAAIEENAEVAVAADDSESLELDPRNLPAMIFDIQQLKYLEQDWGNWHFELEPHQLGASITNLSSEFAGSKIEADGVSRLDWGYNGQEHLTVINLQLSLTDVGDIFRIVNDTAAVSSETGEVSAKLEWLGVPWEPALAELGGEVGVLLNDGQFDAESQGEALLNLIALFSIDNWGRRLRFDFSDLTEGGTGYRSFNGNFGIENGLVTTLEPVNISLTTGHLTFDGQMDLNENQVNAELVATLPVRNNLAWVTAAVAGIPAAAGVWLFGELFKDELDSMASVTYSVTGDLTDPSVDAKRAVDLEEAIASEEAADEADAEEIVQ